MLSFLNLTGTVETKIVHAPHVAPENCCHYGRLHFADPQQPIAGRLVRGAKHVWLLTVGQQIPSTNIIPDVRNTAIWSVLGSDPRLLPGVLTSDRQAVSATIFMK
jgi:hypothetical protein